MQLYCCHSRQLQSTRSRIPTTGLSRCFQCHHPLPTRPLFHQFQSAIHQPRPYNRLQLPLIVGRDLLPVSLALSMLARMEEHVLHLEIIANVKRISRGMIAAFMLVSELLVWRVTTVKHFTTIEAISHL